MQKKWVEVQDSKGNKVIINPEIVYKYKALHGYFSEQKQSA